MYALAISDVRLYSEATAHVLQAAGLAATAVAGPPEQAAAIVEGADVLVALVDARMSESVRMIRRIHRERPTARIIVLGVDEIEGEVIAYVEAGAVGYVPRSAGIDELLAAISNATRDESSCSPRITAALMTRVTSLAERQTLTTERLLTRREFEVVALVSQGLSNKEIAQRLVIQPQTAKNHVHNILKKLNVRRRTEVAAWLDDHSVCVPTNERSTAR
jgi:DNA-binding NarL/FixJ family response regulator